MMYFVAAGMMLLMLIAAYIYWFRYFPSTDGNGTIPSTQQPGIEIPKDSIPPLPAKSSDKNVVPPPMASRNTSSPVTSPRYTVPEVRGENQGNAARKQLLQQLWYAPYPIVQIPESDPLHILDSLLMKKNFTVAYSQIQRLERKLPENDTLRLMKGYCLMEMGEGTTALSYLEATQPQHTEWAPHIQWMKGLCLLLSGDDRSAIQQFKQIAQTTNHPYYQQSKRALLQLGAKK